MIFKTKEFVLRPWELDDAESLYCFAKNPNIGPIAGWPPHESIEDSLNVIRTVFSKKETYAIEIDGVAVGCVGMLFHPDCNHYWGDNCAEIGYWIAQEYWGRGIVVKASEIIIDHIFENFDVCRIYATYRCENNRSKRVLEKLGFKYYTELRNINYLGEEFSEIAMVLEK